MLLDELRFDVAAMSAVYAKPANDIIWKDLENFVTDENKAILVEEIRRRV